VKIVPKVWTFLPSKTLLRAGPQKSYLRYHACSPAGHMEKFREVIPTSPKVVGTHMPKFKPNFKCSPLNFLGGPLSPFGMCTSIPWSIPSTCTNLMCHFIGKSSKTEYLIWASDCNLHSLNAVIDQNLFIPVNFKVSYVTNKRNANIYVQFWHYLMHVLFYSLHQSI